ncbi:DUF1542 domain-containing protein [Streptococcus pneumoniae]|uniref:DUF1542 domain-containing protein n=2 Tax=Streptococcus pneumoniae TaxID=1313 RepID=UPI0005DF012B|nr:DUF1542 domain-containing protein [Streptococcus pneumoniae]CJC76183.1 surface anchored protein [Streptococcus pneumoniae]
MRKSYRDDNGEKVFRYSIRKYHFGAASVAVAALMFFANGAVAASETITPTTASDIVKVDSDSNADGDPGTSDEEDSSKVSTRQPLELKSVDELKGQEAPVEENNQVQAAAESETTGVESNSAQPETNPDSQEAPQAEGEGKQDQSTPVSNQTSSTSLLQPRTLKNNQSDYDPIPLGDDEDDEDDVRDGLFSSENPVTTIQPRSSRSVQPKENSSGVHSVRAEAKKNRFGQVKGKNLIHGDDPANYIKFKDANNQEVQKPADVKVTWERKPSTVEAGINKTGVVKVTYHVTDENGIVRDEVRTVTINTPVYHATLVQNPFVTTYGREFVNKNQPRDGRRYINYNGRAHFNLSHLRVYWENSSGAAGNRFADGTRPWLTNYLGKKREQLMVRYPGDSGRYDSRNDDYGERHEILDGTFIVKPVKPSIQASLGKIGKDRVTVDNVNSGTTVVVYDAANPKNLIELGRTMVAKEGDYKIKNGVEVPLNSGVTLKKGQKIVTKVIYAIMDNDQRTESDVSDTLTVKESLIANGIHVIKGESYTGAVKDRIRYNDSTDAERRTALPGNATASWAQNPNYTTLGTNNYTANVTIPGQGSATVKVPVHVYAPASLKANSYNNKQGTLSNGDNPENYIEFKDGNTVVTKPNNVTVRWQGGVVPRINTPGHNRGVIEVVYPGNAGASSTVVKTFTVQLPTYHTTATATEYTRTIGDNFVKTNARDYATTHNWNVGGSQYVWKNDETANREYSAENWGKVNGDWLGKKKNKVKVYYGNDNGSNSHSENLAEETEEITFITKPKTPNVTATALNGKAGQRNQQVTVNNVTPGTTVELYNGDIKIGSVDVPKANSEAYTDTKTVTVTVNGQLPLSSNIRAKTIYMPNNANEKVESDFSTSVQSTTEGPQAPEISQNPENLLVKATVGQGGSTKVTLTYTDANGRMKEVGFTKNGQFWDKDNANADTTVSITNESNGTGKIQLQPGTAQEGSTVTIKQKTATSEFSTPATTKVLGRLMGLTNVAQADGSVDITVPDTATKFDLTYRNQQNNTTETLHYSKDTQGRWGNVTGITADGNRFTLPKGLVTDGTTVSVIASNDNKTTKTVTSDAKFEMPDATTHTQRENGDGVITLPSTADSVTVTYTDAQDTAKTVTVTKNASNQWASTAALPEGVTLNGNELNVAYKNINSNGNVKTVSTRGTGNVRSQEAVENIELNHIPVSTQAVVIAAGATPTNDDLGRGVTFAKRSITAKSIPAAVPAGTSAEIPATLTYNDGSTEDVTITVKSKPTAPSFDNLENHGTYSGLSSISKVISGTAMPGAEKVKLTLQDGTVKEITPQADGSWFYTLGATEYLTQSFSGQFNGVFNQNKVKAVQVKDGVESEETTANVAPGQATVDSVYKAGRAITVNIPHDIEAGYVRVNGTDYGIQKVNGTWRVISTAPNAAKLEISNTVVDPTNKAVTKVTFSVKNNDDALYTPPFKIGNSPVRFRTYYSKNGTINTPTPQIRGTDGWADSPTPKNTKPTVNFTADHTIEENKVFASPTVEELKDYFEGHDAEDDASLTVGYSASNRGKLRVQVFTQDTNQSVRANAQGRIDPGNYRLVLSTNDAADAESEPITRNIIVKTYADVYRDKVLYPANDDKVIYDDTAISNGNFTTAAKTSFKEKIQEANRQNPQLPTSVTYSVGNTDDKTKVAVINFPDGSTIDISHAVVAKPTVPTITRTHADKVSDADRTISGTALQSATKVTIYFQDGRGEQGHADVVPVNGQWTYTLPTGRYLRQTEHTSLPGSSSVPVNVTQTVFDATSDKTAVYVAKDRNFTGKQIVGTKGSQELTALENDAKKGINYTERNTPKDFPSDFDATWKETPDITTVGTRTYTAKVFEKDKGDAVSQEISVEVTVKADTPSKVTAVQKDNGDVSLSLPSDGESVSISYRAEGVDKTLKLSKAGGNWSVTEGDRTVLAGDQVVLSYKGLDRTQVISTSATAGSDKYLSEAASDTYTVKEHSVTIAPLTKPFEQNVTDKDLLDAVNADHKKSAKLKDGTSYPTTDGFHDIELTVTYEDGSMENVSVKYKVTDTSKNNINQIAKAKKDAIDGDNQLTNEEKKAAKDKVDAAADKAKQAVDAATTNDGVTQAQNNATTNSNSVDTTPHSKSNAKAEIDTKVEEANNAIDQNKDMTDDERREAKKAVKDAADKAKEAIDNATTDADVTRAKNNGKQAINDINPQPAPRPNPVLTPRPDNGGNTGTSVTPSARSRRSVAFAGGTPSSQEKTVDKSELHKLVEELETRLKDLDGIDQSVIDAAKNILGEGQEALRNTDLTEAGLKEITAKVKEALESLKGKQATKDEEETKEMKEIRKEQGHLPYGTMIGSLLALLGLLLFLIARRKKESELKKLTKELTKVLQESDLTSVDAKVLDQVREALAQAVAFLANEKESDHTEDELIEKLKAILAQLR